MKNGKKGAAKSNHRQAEQRTIQEIAREIVNAMAQDNPRWDNLASKVGITSVKSVKELMVTVCMMNTMKRGNLDDVLKLAEILGENNALGNGQQPEDDPLTKALREEADRLANL